MVKKNILSGTCIIVLFFIFSCAPNNVQVPAAQNGILDLSNWDLNIRTSVRLDGEWDFYPGQLLFPQDFTENSGLLDNKSSIIVPGQWKLPGNKNVASGYATYRLTINLKEPDSVMGLKILPILSSYSLYINNKLITACGTVGKNIKTSVPRYEAKTIYFYSDTNTFPITIQVSNFHHAFGGINYSLILGSSEEITRIKRDKETFDSFFLGSMFIMFIYSMSLFFIRKKDRTPLYIAFFCLVFAIKILITGERFIIYLFPNIAYEFQKKIEYILPLLGIILLIKYFNNFFPGVVSKKQVRVFYIILLPVIIISVLPLRIYARALVPLVVFCTFILIYLILILVKIFRSRSRGLHLLSSSIIIVFMSIFLEVLASNHIIIILNYQLYSSLGIMLGVFFESFNLSKKYQIAYKKADDLSHKLKKYSAGLEMKVDERTRELIASQEQKTRFFVNIAHETKTPLTLISNYLNKYINEHKQNKDILIVKQNIDKLLVDMINFLDVEKLNKGQSFFNHNKITDFSNILSDKIRLFKETARCKNIELTASIIDNLYVKIDPLALDRIINNLLDNAVRYTKDEGNIIITLSSKANNICFTVTDSGIGMTVEQQKNIFKPYYQASHEKGNRQGIGMGLYIVHSIITDLGGNIEIESSPNQGTCFTVSLPEYTLKGDDIITHKTDNSVPVVHPLNIKPEEEEYDEKKSTVFIVEDNKEMLLFLQSSMKDSYNVYYACNGKEALIKIKWIPRPDLIISDIMMDEMDGYEFYDNLKTIEELKNIPLIFLTAKTAKEEKLKGLIKGAVDYISKPFLIDELMAKINSLIFNRKNHRQANIHEFEDKISELLHENSTMSFERIIKKFKINPKEKIVIILLKEGLEYKEIASKLNLSISGIKKRIFNIYQKCDVQNKVELFNLFL